MATELLEAATVGFAPAETSAVANGGAAHASLQPINHIRLDQEGIAWIDGVKVRVLQIVMYIMARPDETPEEYHASYPHISIAQFHAALAYYNDHKEIVDAQIVAWNEEVDYYLAEAETRQPPLTRAMLEDRLRAWAAFCERSILHGCSRPQSHFQGTPKTGRRCADRARRRHDKTA